MRGFFRVVLAGTLLLAAGIVLAPAAWLDRPLAARTHERLRLVEAHGFWWRGRGVLTTADGHARLPIAWHVAFAPLLSGVLAVDLGGDGDDGSPSGSLRARGGTLEARDLRLRVPAALVPALAPALQPFALGGELRVHAPSIVFRGDRGTGTLDATWQRARVTTAYVALDLGTVSMSAAPAGDALAGTIRNTGGDVAIAGTIGGRAGTFDAALTVAPTPGAPEMVRQALPLLGPPDGAGGVRIAWRSGR